MRCMLLICACVSFSVSSAPTPKSVDLTQFDLPFLLGDWYLVNPNPNDSTENFRTIKLTLNSNYDFQINIQKKDYSVEHWQGSYTADNDTLILGMNSEDPQVYAYTGNHNLLSLNGVTFVKALSNTLAGIWSSEHLSGDDLMASEVEKMDLILQPDFVFLFRVINQDGEEAVHKGVYYTEDDNLVLIYENGEHSTRYSLTRDQLTLEGEGGGMYAVLNRVE
ncbi:hypothetical protein M9194_16935 [Vibrio sp. S4M6]|uniref:hypothetical protein n=1 Tax=Vibrio sinus TaxID=2946865 RepID=UPI00202AAB96|nr:hypothetical protein [Vibrio sinus]MCL9783116.1 hypothetical protein [Vibrio sinus]